MHSNWPRQEHQPRHCRLLHLSTFKNKLIITISFVMKTHKWVTNWHKFTTVSSLITMLWNLPWSDWHRSKVQLPLSLLQQVTKYSTWRWRCRPTRAASTAMTTDSRRCSWTPVWSRRQDRHMGRRYRPHQWVKWVDTRVFRSEVCNRHGRD